MSEAPCMSDTPIPMDRVRAVAIVAQYLAATATCDQWEMYPEIGEHDWAEIERDAGRQRPPQPSVSEFAAAYKFLAARAGEVTG